jgi:hypothetical protein
LHAHSAAQLRALRVKASPEAENVKERSALSFNPLISNPSNSNSVAAVAAASSLCDKGGTVDARCRSLALAAVGAIVSPAMLSHDHNSGNNDNDSIVQQQLPLLVNTTLTTTTTTTTNALSSSATVDTNSIASDTLSTGVSGPAIGRSKNGKLRISYIPIVASAITTIVAVVGLLPYLQNHFRPILLFILALCITMFAYFFTSSSNYLGAPNVFLRTWDILLVCAIGTVLYAIKKQHSLGQISMHSFVALGTLIASGVSSEFAVAGLKLQVRSKKHKKSKP